MENTKNPTFSIIIPVKNGAHSLSETLKSISKQNYKDFEVIVVDDGSTDDTPNIVNKFKGTLIKLPKSYGAAYARNKGAEKAKGSFLIFLDADIILFKDALKRAQEYIKRNPKFLVFFGTFSPNLRFKNLFSQYKHLYLCYYYLRQGKQLHTIDTSLTFIKKEVFDKFKFNSDIKISEDTELGMRLTKAGYIITNPKNINMEHVKYYSFKSFFKTDFVRGMRFSRLFLKSILKDKIETKKKTFFLKPLNIYLNVGLIPFIFLSLILSLIFNNLFFVMLILFLISFSLINLDFWNYLRKNKGFIFTLKSSLVTFVDALVMNIGAFITFTRFIIYGKKSLG